MFWNQVFQTGLAHLAVECFGSCVLVVILKLKTGMPCYHVTMSYHFTMDLDNVLRISEISQPVVKVMGALLAGGTGP